MTWIDIWSELMSQGCKLGMLFVITVIVICLTTDWLERHEEQDEPPVLWTDDDVVTMDEFVTSMAAHRDDRAIGFYGEER